MLRRSRVLNSHLSAVPQQYVDNIEVVYFCCFVKNSRSFFISHVDICSFLDQQFNHTLAFGSSCKYIRLDVVISDYAPREFERFEIIRAIVAIWNVDIMNVSLFMERL